ncbi:MAG: class I SAM-dependent methyltransferase [Deltaproteobacteria bacterium]|nr:class I SAM-dependent methyltransferase [Deltaproteobacteria bacterium]
MMTHAHYREGRPSSFLVDHMDLLPKGRVLDVAMGRGRNAVYLARQGFEVEGIDISREALDAARVLAKESRVTLNLQRMDLESEISLPHEIFDVIVCFNYLHRPLIPQLRGALRLGGMMIYETYIVDQAQFGRPKNPKHLLEHNELLKFFNDFRCIRYREGILERRKAVAGYIGIKN